MYSLKDIPARRLFRLTISNHSSPLSISQLNQSLLESWRSIQNYYEKCSIIDRETDKTSFQNASEELLLGVTLLVIGENLNDQPLKFQIVLRDKKGKYLLSVGSQGSGPGEFWMPSGLFIDHHDRLYVCDTYNNRIQTFQLMTENQLGDTDDNTSLLSP